MDFAEFERRVRERGLVARDCGNGHWRVEGGKFEVNWWPLSRRKTIYVNGHAKERTTRYGDFEKVLELAVKDPEVAKSRSYKTGRKKNYTRVKRRKLRKSNKCHWCGCELNFESATIDHVIPLARGGSNADDNLVLSCEPCNKEKGHEIWTKEDLKNDKREEKKDQSHATRRDLASGEVGVGRSGAKTPTT